MIDWARVEELITEIGADDFCEVVELFLEEVDAAMSNLDAENDPKTALQTLHFVKGCAWNLGFGELGQLCAQHERAEQVTSQDTKIKLKQVYAASRIAFLDGLEARSINAPAA